MKLYVKRIIFIALLFLGALCVGIFKTPLHFQTDLTSFINTQNKDGWPITEITNKFSLVINVVVKTSDQLSGEIVSQQIQDIVNSDDFKGLDIMTNNVSPHDFITMVKQHNNRILSDKYRQILIDGNYQEITNIAKNRVETSIAPSMLPLSVDPFMLITDYVSGMNNGNTNWVPQNGVLWQYRAPDNFYTPLLPKATMLIKSVSFSFPLLSTARVYLAIAISFEYLTSGSAHTRPISTTLFMFVLLFFAHNHLNCIVIQACHCCSGNVK